MSDTIATTASRGFALPSSGSEARRQLHLTLGLVTMLAIAIVSAGVAVGGHPLAVKQDVVASRAPAMMHAETSAPVAKQL